MDLTIRWRAKKPSTRFQVRLWFPPSRKMIWLSPLILESVKTATHSQVHKRSTEQVLGTFNTTCLSCTLVSEEPWSSPRLVHNQHLSPFPGVPIWRQPWLVLCSSGGAVGNGWQERGTRSTSNLDFRISGKGASLALWKATQIPAEGQGQGQWDPAFRGCHWRGQRI